MSKEYECFVRDRAHAVSGREVVLALRDLTPGRKKYRGLNVRGMVSQPAKPGEPLLWLRSVVGLREAEPCSIRIVEELPEVIPAAPFTGFFDALLKLER